MKGRRRCTICDRVIEPHETSYSVRKHDIRSYNSGLIKLWLCEEHGKDLGL